MFTRTAIISSTVALSLLTISYADSKDVTNKKIVVVGGGAAGVGVSAMLRNEGMKNITIVDPSKTFHYQPFWTLVAAGIKSNDDSVKDLAEVVPKNVSIVSKAVAKFHPEKNSIELDDGSVITYDYLIVAAGIQIDWEKIPGLTAALNDKKSGVVSIYDHHHSTAAWDVFNTVEKGRLIFTMPNTVVKCAGAPQKIMWLIEEMLRDKKIRSAFSVEFWVPGAAMFGVKKYADMLEEIRAERDVKASFKQELVSVDGAKKVAVFKSLVDNSLSEQQFEVLHVTPPMSAPNFLRGSPISDAAGWVEVNKHTLQSTKYPNVFGLGDCVNTPNSKTAAAITAQAPVLVHNLLALNRGKELDGKYTGYASCPLVVGKNRVILAEFGYDGKIMETFDRETGRFPYNLLGQDGRAQQYLFSWFKTTLFPFAFWNLWIHGRWYGSHGPFKPNVVPPKEKEGEAKK